MKLHSKEWTLLSSRWCMRIARVLAPLGSAGGMLFALIAAAASWTLWAQMPTLQRGAGLTLAEMPLVLASIIIGMLVHELLHLAAFARAGGTEGSITASLRLGVIPGFSAAMKVKRHQLSHRDWALVSVAGPFVTGCIATVVHSAFHDVHWVQVATLMTMVSSVFNLLPWRDSDGYHLLQSIKAINSHQR